MKLKIYCARNVITGKVYIGQTRRSLKRRKYEHRTAAEKGAKTPFYKSIRKFGFGNFRWSILSYADSFKELDRLERFFIGQYRAFNRKYGYNCLTGGSVPANLKRSQEHKDAISQAKKAWWDSHPDAKKHLRRFNKTNKNRRKAASNRLHKLWKDPSYITEQSARAKEVNKKIWSDKEFKQRKSKEWKTKVIEFNKDPEFQKKRLAGIRRYHKRLREAS